MLRFEHDTVYESPRENAQWLHQQLAETSPFATVDVVTHSRGGLVAQSLPRDGSVQYRKAVHVACPFRGSPLAELRVLMHLVEPYCSSEQDVVDALRFVERKSGIHAFPGLAAMDPDVVNGLYNTGPFDAVDTYSAVVDSPTYDWLLPVFGEPHDSVVPTSGCDLSSANNSDPFRGVMHTELFKQEVVVERVQRSLDVA